MMVCVMWGEVVCVVVLVIVCLMLCVMLLVMMSVVVWCDDVGRYWEGEMIDFMLFGGFGYRLTDKQTLVVVESLSQLVLVFCNNL